MTEIRIPRPDIKENHWQGHFDDQTWVEVDHYNERGLNLNYFWRLILDKPTATNEDMEAARFEACKTFIQLGGHVIISVRDSKQIPENDRNTAIDQREGHKQLLGRDYMGGPIYSKKKTGDNGDQYYDWKPETDYTKRINKVRYQLEVEKRKNGNNGHHKR
jgi:hypothetical protein